MHVEQLDVRCFPCLQSLSFEECKLSCNKLLLHAADLPLLRVLKFRQAIPACRKSAGALCKLKLLLQGRSNGVIWDESFGLRDDVYQ